MSPNQERVEEIYKLARRADHRTLRTRLQDDVTWRPATTAKWNACDEPDEVVRTLLWRAEANRLRPGQTIDLGDRGEPHVTPEILEIAEAIDARREPGSIVKALPLVS